ncbi:hypothetical protein LRR81_01580 [Metabacillus sp. GX 13764]|uniref:hypothetical protein n=1 Tax=Metabacillus kandeliae TaxID=2900151 RepID=UPI001E32E8A2|nr:hypothetical protein [Metabacillus kandeliae]MCD7032902.1 hypothetical protein [Metabacillus kandeliae]
MFQNEKGQTLLTVMLISLIFTVLGLSILAAAVNGAGRTQLRVDDITLTADANKTLNEIIASFRNTVTSSNYKLTEVSAISPLLSTAVTNLKADNRGLCIIDLTNSGGSCPDNGIAKKQGYGIDPEKNFTRVYQFSYKAEDGNLSKVVNKTVILSPTPSFLNYAVGSGPDGTLNLNGFAEIRGNLYANSLKTSNIASYKDSNSPSNGLTKSDTLYPSINGTATIRNDVNGIVNFSEFEKLKAVFDSRSQVFIKHETEDFIDVKFDETVSGILNSVTKKGLFAPEDVVNSDNAMKKLLGPCLPSLVNNLPKIVDGRLVTTTTKGTCQLGLASPWKPLRIIEEKTNYNDIENLAPNPRETIVYTGVNPDGSLKDKNAVNPLYIQNNLTLGEDNLLIVNGDLVISATSEKPLQIQGKIIVLGDVRILGNNSDKDGNDETGEEDDNIEFNSTIYALGNAAISNTNVKGKDGKQLVLMAKGDMNVNRINEFSDASKSEPLKAFLYTEKNADLYGVGSAFNIRGGLFAKNNLTINAIRQKNVQRDAAGNLKDRIASPGSQQAVGQVSRFQVDYDSSALLDQISSLPKTDYYQVVMQSTLVN